MVAHSSVSPSVYVAPEGQGVRAAEKSPSMTIGESAPAEVSPLARSPAGSPHAPTPRRRAPRRAVRRALASVPARHPVGQDIVDCRGLNEPLPSAIGLERTPLPEEVGVDALVDADRRAGAIVLAFRILAPQVDKVVPAWPLEPEVEEEVSLRVAGGVGAANAAVDHVEVGVLVASGAAAQRGERLHVERQRGREWLLEADEIVEVDVIEIEFEVAVMRVEALPHDRERHLGGECRAMGGVDGRETLRIHVAADLQEAELLVRPADEGRADLPVGHDDVPAVAEEEVEHTSDDALDVAASLLVVHHVVGDTEPEEDAGVLVARGVAPPVVGLPIDRPFATSVALLTGGDVRDVGG